MTLAEMMEKIGGVAVNRNGYDCFTINGGGDENNNSLFALFTGGKMQNDSEGSEGSDASDPSDMSDDSVEEYRNEKIEKDTKKKKIKNNVIPPSEDRVSEELGKKNARNAHNDGDNLLYELFTAGNSDILQSIIGKGHELANQMIAASKYNAEVSS